MSDRSRRADSPSRPSLERIPYVGRLLAFGPDEPVFDGLILTGPLLVVALAVGGRNLLTTALALGYVLAFVAYVGWQAVSS